MSGGGFDESYSCLLPTNTSLLVLCAPLLPSALSRALSHANPVAADSGDDATALGLAPAQPYARIVDVRDARSGVVIASGGAAVVNKHMAIRGRSLGSSDGGDDVVASATIASWRSSSRPQLQPPPAQRPTPAATPPPPSQPTIKHQQQQAQSSTRGAVAAAAAAGGGGGRQPKVTAALPHLQQQAKARAPAVVPPASSSSLAYEVTYSIADNNNVGGSYSAPQSSRVGGDPDEPVVISTGGPVSGRSRRAAPPTVVAPALGNSGAQRTSAAAQTNATALDVPSTTNVSAPDVPSTTDATTQVADTATEAGGSAPSPTEDAVITATQLGGPPANVNTDAQEATFVDSCHIEGVAGRAHAIDATTGAVSKSTEAVPDAPRFPAAINGHLGDSELAAPFPDNDGHSAVAVQADAPLLAAQDSSADAGAVGSTGAAQ